MINNTFVYISAGYWLGGNHNGSEWNWIASGLTVPRDASANKWGWGGSNSSNVKGNIVFIYNYWIEFNNLFNLGTEDDCIELRFVNESVSLAWRSVKCKEERPYICQRPHFV